MTNVIRLSFLALVLTTLWGRPCEALDGEALDGTYFGSVDGQCEQLVIGNSLVDCSKVNGVMVALLPNGRTLLMIPTGLHGGVATFVGERDSRPTAQSYRLYVSHVNVSSDGEENIRAVKGICNMQLGADRRIWYRLGCKAEGDDGSSYLVAFNAGGNRLDLRRFGDGSHTDEKTDGSR
jgi:hypothetical protein